MSVSVGDIDIHFRLDIFAAILEQDPGLVAIRELESGKLLYINETGSKILGTDNYLLLELLMEQNKIGTSDATEKSASNGLSVNERQLKNINGEIFIGAYEEISLQYNHTNYCFFRITEILSPRQYRQQLDKELNRFETLFNNASIGILVTNKQGEIIIINDFALRQFAYQLEMLVGKQVELLIPLRVRDRHIGHRERYNATPQNRPMGIGMNLFAVRKDGTEFPVEISLSHYSNEEGNFIIVYISNITERKKAEERVEKLYNELEEMVEDRTTKLRKTLEELENSKGELTMALSKEKELGDLKSRFISMASHEFRTPLSTILSSIFLIKHYDADQDQPLRNKHIQRIINNVNLLTDTLNDFLSLSKIEEGKIQVRNTVFDIEEHINTVIQEMQDIAKNNQTITYNHTGDKNLVSDPSLIKHIVMNLLGNAIKFSTSDSQIEIETTINETSFTLLVKDNGMGISAEDQQHLFERFHRGANVNNIPGTGLGLHIVQRYAEIMEGKIYCSSKLNQGTTFTVIFPVSK